MGFNRLLIIIFISSCLAACAGSQATSTLPDSPRAQSAAVAHARAHATILVRVPRREKHRGRYISPSTKSGALVVTAASGCASCTPSSTVGFGLTAGSPGCQSEQTGLICQVSIPVHPGSYTAALSLYDGPLVAGLPTGAVLSANQNFPLVVELGQPNVAHVVLDGVASSIAVVPTASAALSGTQATGFSITGSMPQQFLVVPEDAGGNYLLGANAPTATIVSAPANTVLTAPSASPNVWTVKSTYSSSNPTVPGNSSISVQATPVPNSGGATIASQIPLKLYQPWIYVANRLAIVAFDEAGNQKTLAGTFPGITAPRYGIYSPSNGYIYLGQYQYPNSQILAFDAMGNAQTTSGSFPDLQDPGQMAIDTTNGLLYVPNYLANTTDYVTIYDLQGNEQGPTPGNFSAMTDGAMLMMYDPGYDLVYGANYYTAGLNGFNASGEPMVGGFADLYEPVGMALDSADGTIFVANGRGSSPGVILAFQENGTQKTLTGSFAGASFPKGIAYDPYDGELYVVNGNTSTYSIAAYDAQGNAQTLAAGAFPGIDRPTGIFVVP